MTKCGALGEDELLMGPEALEPVVIEKIVDCVPVKRGEVLAVC